jgi:hypothetical protein
MPIFHGPTVRALERRDPATRVPGQHARVTVLRLRMRTLVTLGVLAVLTGVFGRAFGLRSPLFIGSELGLLVAMFAVSRYVMPLVDRRDRGAVGEERVGGLLDQLDNHVWRVVHDASFDHGNVDHIVIGPAGIFSVETKSHPGPVRVRGVHGATLRQAQGQRETLERVTGERVEALIVYSRAWVDKPLARRRGVRVVPSRMLIGYLERHSHTLTAEQVEQARARVVSALAEAQTPPDRLLGWPPPLRNRS